MSSTEPAVPARPARPGPPYSHRRVVALGGGHGLAASLAALRQLTDALTAVVTVADDGGSSGRLRREFDCLPPGDLRMALAALCDDERWGQTWASVLQHRFASAGDLDGHATGNLLIVTLWELLGDHVAGLDWVATLLGARGRVLPMALQPIDMLADIRGADPARPDEVELVRGQSRVASTQGTIMAARIEPELPAACPAALEAISSADMVVLGPGSWYTSVIPHLLVPDLREALVGTEARIVVTMNLTAPAGETANLSHGDHLRALAAHAPGMHVDTVVAPPLDGAPADLEEVAETIGARVLRSEMADPAYDDRHDPGRLSAAYAQLLEARDGE